MEHKKDTCITLLADKNYLHFFPKIYEQLREVGKFDGDINLITNKKKLKIKPKNFINVNIFEFEQIKFSKNCIRELNNIPNGRNKDKPYQWNKFYLFDAIFKNWKFNLYIDINMTINKEINDFFDLKPINKLYAPYDAYPDLDWTLESQFTKNKNKLESLKKRFDLETRKYFQTGILYYDTNLITNEMFNNLIDLVEKYPLSKNNEQGIFNLYFLYEYPRFEALPESCNNNLLYTYWKNQKNPAIITKSQK